MNGHLNDDQWAELAAGGWAGAGAREHLDTCAACRAELDAVRGFAHASLADAEARAARLSPAAVRAAAGAWRPAEPAWWAAAAAALVAAVLLGTVHMRDAANPASERSAGAAAGESRQQIEEDNQLLSNIDAELKWSQGGAVQMPAGSLSGRRSEGSQAGPAAE